MCELGGGDYFLFGWDSWLKGITLKDRLSRPFELFDNMMATVVEMKLLGGLRVVRPQSGVWDYGHGRRMS